MKSADKRLILFDLDGTLTDPGLGITNSVMYALDKFGLPVGEREEYYKYIGPPLLDSFINYCGVDMQAAKELLRLYRVYFSEYGLFENLVYEGILELLEGLKASGAVLSLATSKPDAFAVRILKEFDLYRYFDHAACSTMDEKRSSKSAVIAYGLSLAGRKAGDPASLMIGDREYDIIGAQENGIASVGVSYGYGTREELAACGAVKIADSVSELAAVLEA